jgi:hypothetical protein
MEPAQAHGLGEFHDSDVGLILAPLDPAARPESRNVRVAQCWQFSFGARRASSE